MSVVTKTAAQLVDEFSRGLFRRYRLTIVEDYGHGDTAVSIGTDTYGEAKAIAEKVEAYALALVRDGYRLPLDPEVNLYFWIADGDTVVFSGISVAS